MLAVGLVNDLSFYLTVSVVGPFYYATPENGWARLFHDYLPRWLFPQDPNAIRWFFEGLPKEQGVPWGAWAAALTPWLLFAALFYGMMFCISALVRRQWSDRERFSFPIVQIPVEIALAGQSCAGGLFGTWIFWAGALVPITLHLTNGLAQHFPSIPRVPLLFSMDGLLQQGPWLEVRPLVCIVIFAVIGFSFLLPLEISLSFAFFFLFYKLECYLGGLFGAQMHVAQAYICKEFCQDQEIGAFLAIFGGVLYGARAHLREAWHSAFRAGRKADEGEAMPYRWAYLGLFGSLAGMTVWLWLAGVHPLLALLCLALFVVIAVVVAWAVTGGGQFFMQNSFAPLNVMMAGIGSGPIGPGSFTMLRITQMIFMYDMRSLQMPTLLHGFKASDACGVQRASMAKAMALALVVAVLVGTATHIWYASHHSAVKIGGWGYLDAPRLPGLHIVEVFNNPKELSFIKLLWIGGGALFTTWLLALRMRYFWFPLHPIGFAFAGSYAMYTVWFSFFIGWLLKLLVTRYGGMRGYLFLRPFFLGLVLGDCLMASFWAIVGTFTKVGYPPFSGVA